MCHEASFAQSRIVASALGKGADGRYRPRLCENAEGPKLAQQYSEGPRFDESDMLGRNGRLDGQFLRRKSGASRFHTASTQSRRQGF
jgi:hypothetical protein